MEVLRRRWYKRFVRVPVRPDGWTWLLWAAAAVGASGLTWWDAQDAALPDVAPQPADDLVWMDTGEVVGPSGQLPAADEVTAPSGLRAGERPAASGERSESSNPALP